MTLPAMAYSEKCSAVDNAKAYVPVGLISPRTLFFVRCFLSMDDTVTGDNKDQ